MIDKQRYEKLIKRLDEIQKEIDEIHQELLIDYEEEMEIKAIKEENDFRTLDEWELDR